ncbi:uncharacterized protein LOC135809748 isoform X1 [Sycon ciliatum]|uniref:uncharacterized protein LOC135809748 isoform X1 n=1 Tax=Sycon ciliatum TaxID=27933 RepID=UPI0031F6F9E1
MRTSSTATVMWIVPSLTVLLLLEAGLLAKSIPARNWDGKDHSEILKDLVLNYKDHTRDPRANTECSVNASYTGQCNLDCQCVDGKWKCCRLRKSVKNLSQEERDRFTHAYLKAVKNEIYKPAMRAILWSHATFFCKTITNKEQLVYSDAVGYHNLLLLALESLLRLIDCRVTLPYWDVALEYEKSYSEQLPEGFGGNGVPPDYCVLDGPYRKGEFVLPKFVYNGVELPFTTCLKRNISATSTPFSYMMFTAMLTIPPENSEMFDLGFFLDFDRNFHASMGGTFEGMVPAMDPLFYMIHNFANKMLVNFQMQGPQHLIGGGLWNNTVSVTTFQWFQNKDFLDATSFPNDVCIHWDAVADQEKLIQMGYYAGLETPRTHHIALSYKEVRDMDMDSKAAANYVQFIKSLRATFLSAFTNDENGFHLTKDWYKLFMAGFGNRKFQVQPACSQYFDLDPEFEKTTMSPGVAELIP